jgi:two-component system OmpR family sensor kinase
MVSPLRKVSNPLSLWSLRNRLIVGVVVLSALGFIASDLVARSSLQSFLMAQVDTQLKSVAGGSVLRLDRAGIAPDENATLPPSNDETSPTPPSAKAQTRSPLSPLRQVPTTMSVTLLNPAGKVLGVIGGDLNTQAISNFVAGFTPAMVANHKNLPFTIEAPGADFRVLARVLPSALGSVVVAQSLDNIDQKVIDIGLRPLEAVEVTAESIAAGNLSARLPAAKPDTEVGRLVGSLNKMLARIEESFAARTASENRLRRFVADASHELRTPLTAIRGFAELHRQGAVQGEEQTKELIARIEKESMRMGSLVEDLLLLTRLDQAREMSSDPVNISSSIKEAVESARAAGPNHPITVTMPEEDVYVLGDANRIHQVIANLLANARAHTPTGTPIEVDLEQTDAGTTVSVSDKGPGLSEANQERIFERFYRADPSRARTSFEGSGLGLSIVDAVMRAHGGQVSVASTLGDGATFTLFFPAN